MGNVHLVRVKCSLNTLLRVFSLAQSTAVSASFSSELSISSIAHFLSIRLTQTNYIPWKTQIMSLIEVQDLLSFVDGTEKEPKKVTLIENSRIGAN